MEDTKYRIIQLNTGIFIKRLLSVEPIYERSDHLLPSGWIGTDLNQLRKATSIIYSGNDIVAGWTETEPSMDSFMDDLFGGPKEQLDQIP